jgi:anthranilate synthase
MDPPAADGTKPLAVPGAEPLAIYAAARGAGLRPALLESLGPSTAFSRDTILGLAPGRSLEMWDGALFEGGRGGRRLGGAAELLGELETGLRAGSLFPLWIGFFSYEFARHLGLPTGAPMPGLPEAAFRRYDEGWLWRDGRLIASPPGALTVPAAAGTAPPATGLPRIAIASDYARADYIAGVREVQERIRAGWVYQVNLSHRFSFSATELDPLAYYGRLRETNPSPFMGIVEGEDWAVVSGSPERLFERHGEALSARPIAGTRPRGATVPPGEHAEPRRTRSAGELSAARLTESKTKDQRRPADYFAPTWSIMS